MKEKMDTKWMWAIPLGVLLVILLSFATYQWIVPRTDLEVRTVYHEAPGGGGTGATMNVNVLLTNIGNRDVKALKCEVQVLDPDSKVVARHSMDPENLVNGENVEIKISYIGSHYVSYTLELDLSFECSGNSHSRSLSYVTVEDTMNLVFVENIK